jgi:hypothetical protein
MTKEQIRAREIKQSRKQLAEIRELLTASFTEEDDQITSDIIEILIEMTQQGYLAPSKRAKFFHLAVAFLTLAEGFSETEMLAAAPPKRLLVRAKQSTKTIDPVQ